MEFSVKYREHVSAQTSLFSYLVHRVCLGFCRECAGHESIGCLLLSPPKEGEHGL